MAEIILPLSALEQADACYLAHRVADFTTHHGRSPNDTSTWSEWCAVTPSIAHRLWAVACVLPLVYPSRRTELTRVVAEVAYCAASRVQPAASNPRAADALALVRRWLDGAAIPPAKLRLAATYARVAARADTNGDATYAAAFTARAAAYAANAAADAVAVFAADAAEAAFAADDAATHAADAAVYAADAERAQQMKDLEKLLHALFTRECP